MISKWLVAGIVGALLSSTAADAATYSFDLSFSAGPISVTDAVLTSTVDNGGVYTITGASGTIVDGSTDYAITGPSGYEGADNFLSYPATPYVDGNGLALIAINGLNTFSLNLSSFILKTTVGYDAFYQINGGGSTSSDFSALNVSLTPLPSTWTMLIAGFVGVGFFAYRGSRKDSAGRAAV